jgi:hypothetical protein
VITESFRRKRPNGGRPLSCLLWIAALLSIILYAYSGAQEASSNLYLAIVLVLVLMAIIVLTGYLAFQQTFKYGITYGTIQ